VRLKKLREKSKLSQKDLAQLAGVSASTYRDWEYGKQILGEPYIALAEALGVSVYELLSGASSSSCNLIKEIEQVETAVKNLRKIATLALCKR
jgi:transcriptional regulator with XRE-family HTH domain